MLKKIEIDKKKEGLQNISGINFLRKKKSKKQLKHIPWH